MSWKQRRARGPSRGATTLPLGLALAIAGLATGALAADPTPGYPEPVVQWGVQKGETCEAIAKALYGGAQHVGLLLRYNRIACAKGAELPVGATLVLPATVTKVPDARLRSMNPDVRSRPPGGGWSPASSGEPLVSSSSVNTLDKGRADIEFVDRTRVFMAPNTLVVIYGSANQTSVSKTPPPAVEIEAGEVKAGLAALRGGGSVEVAIKGGGRVSASSRDAVVERKGERTTVAVFDGKADVSSAGKRVSVPKNFGSRFVGAAPPSPPRPLPPAPAWNSGGSGSVVIAPSGLANLDASWAPVKNAIAYRFEVARDEGMRDLVVREEVPGKIVAFHAEKMPPGRYYLSVRAIDNEEYLGVAAEMRVIDVVRGDLEQGPGTLGGGAIEANPYGVLTFKAAPRVEIALDDGAFSPLVDLTIDLKKRAPKAIQLRASGASEAATVEVHYALVAAHLTPTLPEPGARSMRVAVAFEGLDGVDIPDRVAPLARSKTAAGASEMALTLGPSGGYGLDVPLSGAPEHVRVDVVDSRGKVLGTWEADVGAEAAPAVAEAPEMPRIGAVAPPWQPGVGTSVLWWSPTAPNAVVLGGSGGLASADVGAAFYARATGSVGPVSLEGAIRSNPTGNAATADSAAWFGARFRAYRLGLAELELGPAVRVGIPVTKDGPPVRIEPGVAVGGVSGSITWLGDLGVRLRLDEDASRVTVPSSQGFLLAGGTIDLLDWLRASALVDAHLVAGASTDLRGGLSLGLEGGGALFGALTGRVSPWSDDDGHVTIGLGIGVREP